MQWINFLLAAATLTQQTLDFAESELDPWHVPGAAVVIVENGTATALGFGKRAFDKNEPVDKDTLFLLASVTKSFTATLLATFVNEKKITFDDPILTHLPGFSLFAPYPTSETNLKDLLAHRTGLPAFRGDLLGKIGLDDRDILAKIPRITPGSSFREKAQYSNVGYFLAGMTAEALGGAPYKTLLKERLLDPIGMKSSGFDMDKRAVNIAEPHILTHGIHKIVPFDTTGGFPAAGALFSTGEDLGKWITFCLNQGKGLIETEVFKELFEPAMVAEVEFTEAPPITKTNGFSFSLGWDIYYVNGKKIVEKGGALDGARSVVTLIPEMNLGIAVVANLNLTFYPELVRAKFLELAIGAPFAAKEFRDRQELTEKFFAPPEKPMNFLPPKEGTAYSGSYESPLYGAFVVSDNFELVAGPGKWKGTLSPFSNNTFLLTWPVINTGYEKVTFIMGEEGKAIAFETETLGTFRKR